MDTINLAIEAIDRAIPLCISYEGKPKTIEVHAVGLSIKDNAPIIRGFQIDGEASRPLPCWALLRIDKIENAGFGLAAAVRSEEHTSELQSLMRISYAVFCLKKKKKDNILTQTHTYH